MDYFSQIPQIIYPDIEKNDGTFLAVTNILIRSAFLQEILENTSLFYEYHVKDGETAEIIADKLYGDPKRVWIVLLFNKLNNPYYDFPLTTDQLHDMIVSKYGQTLEESQNTIHHYENRVTSTTYFNGIADGVNKQVYTISEQYQNPLTGFAATRPNLPSIGLPIENEPKTDNFGNGVTVTTTHVYHAVSNYDFETLENEKKRNIKLLDVAYVGPVENEFKRLMK